MAFILTLMAGLSTLIGSVVIFFKNKNINNVIVSSLGFAAGVMITVSLTDLLTESFILISEYYLIIPTILLMLLFFVLGVLLSTTIDKVLPTNDDKLYRTGIIAMLAIILHNIPEGIATYMATTSDVKLGITLATAISLHNIPEGISIAVPIYFSTKSRLKACTYTFISGLSEVFGAVLSFLFLKDIVTNLFLGCLFSMIAGIMINISLSELLPTSLKYNKKRLTAVSSVVGILLMLINHFIF